MEKRRVLKFVAAASAVTGGVTLTGNVVSASPLPSDNNINGQAVSSNQRSIEKGQVNSDVTLNLRVRSDASTSSAILGYLKAGDTFEITGEKGNWYKINFNGKSGYVSKDYTHKVSNSNGSTATSKGKAVNLGNATLRIRQSASTSSAILGSLREGETFDIIAKSGQWYNIKTAGIVGFVHGDYVQVIENNTPTTPTNPSPGVTVTKGQVYGVEGSNLRVRTAPSLSASTFGYLLNGEEVEITGESGNWYAIKYKGETGYCSKDYVKKIGNSTSDNNSNGSTNTTPNTPTTFKGEVINADAGLRVRAGASTSSSILGHIYTGSKVDVIGESGSWYKINYNGKEAYVSKDYIKKVTDSNSNNNNNNNNNNDNSGSQVTSKKGEVINASAGLRVRSEANTNSSILGYLYTGDKVDITGESGNWYKINYNGKTAYVSKEYVKEVSEGNSNSGGSDSSVIENKRGKVYNTGGSGLTVRTEATTSSLALGYLMEGQVIEITGTSGDWYKIIFNGKPGYVSSKYIKIVEDLTDEESNSIFEKAFAAMKAQLGSPYVWGGSGEYLTTSSLNSLKAKFPNETAKGWYVRAERYVDKGYRAFDCSGLMQWGFRQAGVVIGRTTWAQIGEGREVSLSDIKPGDLLFYSSLDHVGMYIGDGKWIESPNTNADVRIVDVPWSRVTRARRIIE